VAPTSISPGASQAEIAEAYLGHAERVVRAKLKGRPVGSTDADELSSPRISEAIERRQQVLTDAREANEAAAAHRQEHGWASRLLDGSARRRQTALDSQAARLDKAARRIDRRHDGVVRRIEKNSEKLARNNQRATEDWRWTPAVRKALADQEILTKARVGLAFGDPATVEALSRKDFRTAAQAAETAQERADPRGMALRRLSAAEKTVESDPVALAQARWATAAAIAGDEQTITAVNAGDPAATTQAAAEYQRRKRGDEIRQRQAREAAMALGQPIEQGLRL
jgi:hypothetical protein